MPDSISTSAKADVAAARGRFRTWGAAHPLGALFVGIAIGALAAWGILSLI